MHVWMAGERRAAVLERHLRLPEPGAQRAAYHLKAHAGTRTIEDLTGDPRRDRMRRGPVTPFWGRAGAARGIACRARPTRDGRPEAAPRGSACRSDDTLRLHQRAVVRAAPHERLHGTAPRLTGCPSERRPARSPQRSRGARARTGMSEAQVVAVLAGAGLRDHGHPTARLGAHRRDPRRRRRATRRRLRHHDRHARGPARLPLAAPVAAAAGSAHRPLRAGLSAARARAARASRPG